MKIFFILLISLTFWTHFALGEESLIRLKDIEHPLEDIPVGNKVLDEENTVEDLLNDDLILSEKFEESFNRKSYSHVDPQGIVPEDLLNKALALYDQYGHLFPNKKYITVVNFSSRSSKKRMHLIDMETGNVISVRTAHGIGGDQDHDGYVESLGNVSGSKKSSRGVYKVSEIYYGNYGRSLRLDGLSSSNSNVRSRAIVIHGSDYVKEANVIQGRSWGCFALSWSVKDQVVDRIHGGSLMYADWSNEN